MPGCRGKVVSNVFCLPPQYRKDVIPPSGQTEQEITFICKKQKHFKYFSLSNEFGNQWANSRGKSSNIVKWMSESVLTWLPLDIRLTYNNGNQTFMQHSNDKTLKCFLVSDTDSVKIQIKENNHSLGQVLYIFLQQFRKYVRRKTTAKYSRYSSF